MACQIDGVGIDRCSGLDLLVPLLFKLESLPSCGTKLRRSAPPALFADYRYDDIGWLPIFTFGDIVDTASTLRICPAHLVYDFSSSTPCSFRSKVLVGFAL